ncbi:MAG: hypothetical protein GY820_42080 [Gammaproteobacteria bacterium]|nr:hypothetical protein [Gammaproteobacteria bacterium]
MREFRYRVSFEVMHMMDNEFALDDFSMTPTCFLGGRTFTTSVCETMKECRAIQFKGHSSVVSSADNWVSLKLLDKYKITSCGAVGPRGPTRSQCELAYNDTGIIVDLLPEGSTHTAVPQLCT